MQHLTEEQLIAHYYHDGGGIAAEEHFASCGECRAQFETLRSVLTLIDQLPIPERSDTYGQEVWTRLRWKMGKPTKVGLESPTHVWRTLSAIAAALAIAFIGGVLWHARTQQNRNPQTTIAQAKPAP